MKSSFFLCSLFFFLACTNKKPEHKTPLVQNKQPQTITLGVSIKKTTNTKAKQVLANWQNYITLKKSIEKIQGSDLLQLEVLLDEILEQVIQMEQEPPVKTLKTPKITSRVAVLKTRVLALKNALKYNVDTPELTKNANQVISAFNSITKQVSEIHAIEIDKLLLKQHIKDVEPFIP